MSGKEREKLDEMAIKFLDFFLGAVDRAVANHLGVKPEEAKSLEVPTREEVAPSFEDTSKSSPSTTPPLDAPTIPEVTTTFSPDSLARMRARMAGNVQNMDDELTSKIESMNVSGPRSSPQKEDVLRAPIEVEEADTPETKASPPGHSPLGVPPVSTVHEISEPSAPKPIEIKAPDGPSATSGVGLETPSTKTPTDHPAPVYIPQPMGHVPPLQPFLNQSMDIRGFETSDPNGLGQLGYETFLNSKGTESINSFQKTVLQDMERSHLHERQSYESIAAFESRVAMDMARVAMELDWINSTFSKDLTTLTDTNI